MSTENQHTCILQFRGVTNGNPGPAGVVAALLAKDRTVVCQFREELGHQTVNVAEFRALILGMRHAIRMGYKNIIAEGNSQLVINQFQGHCTIGEEDIKALRNEALKLKASFQSFRIPEKYNSAAASQAKQLMDNEKRKRKGKALQRFEGIESVMAEGSKTRKVNKLIPEKSGSDKTEMKLETQVLIQSASRHGQPSNKELLRPQHIRFESSLSEILITKEEQKQEAARAKIQRLETKILHSEDRKKDAIAKMRKEIAGQEEAIRNSERAIKKLQKKK